MDFKENIKSLVEKRIIEATKKQITAKLFCIAKNLGKPIISQGLFSNPLVNVWETENDMIYDPNKVMDADNWDTHQLGYSFDGLKCGINLCVTALCEHDKLSEIKATFNGILVFAEMDGEIKAYAPFPAWEQPLMMFYDAATTSEKKKVEEQKEEIRISNQNKLSKYWEKFRKLWGY